MHILNPTSSLICGPCARSFAIPPSEALRTGCWTGTGVLKHIETHSNSHPKKPTGSIFSETGFWAVQERARQCYASDDHYFEEERSGLYRVWQTNARHSGQMEYSGVLGEESNTLKFVLPHDEHNRHAMLVSPAVLPTGTCRVCGVSLPREYR
jgi:hypothetical protein